MRAFFRASLVLALAACAEPDLHASTAPLIVANATTDLNGQSKLVCHKESSIGSQMIHSVCVADQSDADRIAAQDKMRQTQPDLAASFHGIGN